MLNAMHVGDVINDLIYQIRPFEVNKGETDRVFRETRGRTLRATCAIAIRLKSKHRAPDWAQAEIQEQ